ncbi:MAG: 3-deoxy-manno-octulosonate cytidylyltransferase [Opitutales bacterium]|nr:3-deoxy-manno-octulosonate cytidylyltransferase [Opitutales bacterium]
METAIIVPARLGSQRFPRKLLYLFEGIPLILWTARRIRAQAPEFPLFFAVAEEELADLLRRESFDTILTDPALLSGTDRLAQANERVGARRVINVQADEPLVRAEQIRQLDATLTSGLSMATLALPFSSETEFRDPNRVKVVMGANGEALYFSRAPIPFARDGQPWGEYPAFLHLGLYAYTGDFLRTFGALPPGRLEQIEKLEQLRALEHGHRIGVGITAIPTIGIDTPADATHFLAHLRS